MNLTQYFPNKFNLNVTSTNVIYLSESLCELKSINKLLDNYFKQTPKIDIDEYMSVFIQEKQEFISSFKKQIDSRKFASISGCQESTLNEMMQIFKVKLEKTISKYKKFKCKLLGKEKLFSEYWIKKKEHFLKFKAVKLSGSTKASTANSLENFLNEKRNDDVKFIEPPKERWIQQYLPKDSAVDQTKDIIKDLGALISTFSQKLHNQKDMTYQSKDITIKHSRQQYNSKQSKRC